MAVSIAQLSADHHHSGFGVQNPTPTLSWRFDASSAKDWRQQSYEVEVTRNGSKETYTGKTSQNLFVPWPSSPLKSREAAQVAVRVTGSDGKTTEWSRLNVEAALLQRSDWSAELITEPRPAPDVAVRSAFRLQKSFNVGAPKKARLYITSHGIYEAHINGQRVGDELLAPGWQSYKHRLHYRVHDVTSLLKQGENTIEAEIAEGWFAGELGAPPAKNIFGDRLGLLAQLENDGQVVCKTDASWEATESQVVKAGIYWGQETNLTKNCPVTGVAEVIPFPTGELISPDQAPVRQIMEVQPIEIIKTPAGKTVLDFGQNLVGWLRVNENLGDITLRHAEVMEHGELGIRPLREAKNIEIIRGNTKGYEAKFTFHGFRYAEITSDSPVSLDSVTAVVISSDLRRTGHFDCSHKLISKLHQNTVWSMRGNFVSIPTDCPQRDERLGWTGDIQVFAPTANFLFDTSAFLSSWLRDLEADQRDNKGIPPVIIPSIPKLPDYREGRPMAIWADASVITPWDTYRYSGDVSVLKTQWSSMCLWLDKGVPRDEKGFYSMETPQYGDWLDPRSPPQLPGNCPSDPFMVANAYLIYTTGLAGRIGKMLNEPKGVEYLKQAEHLLTLFHDEYITKHGRLSSDTQCCYALALKFNLLHPDQIKTAVERLGWLTRFDLFRITTGFAGTPIILQTLADNGMLDIAYRMLQEGENPSWLYPVSMGATTIWERWNSMLEDGSINPGKMTSFNHYALGSVCDFLHGYVGGLSPLEPGWTKALIRPQPGGTVTWAKVAYDSPVGPYKCDWSLSGGKMKVEISVPPNATARVVLPDGMSKDVGSGSQSFEVPFKVENWPPEHFQGPQGTYIRPGYIE